MKIVYNSIIPFKGFLAINICGVLFVRKELKKALTEVDINHESIHTAQIKELFYIGFYLLYLIEWVVRLCQHRNFKKAYRSISFEVEAYKYENDAEYLKTREPHAWALFV